MENLEKIKKVQELITKLGLDNNNEFQNILNIDTDTEEKNKEHEYWNNLNGKCLYLKTNSSIDLIKIINVQNISSNQFFCYYNRVKIDRTYLTYRENATSMYKEFSHTLSTPKIGRYDNYTIIDETTYNRILDEINKYENFAKLTNENILNIIKKENN